jgi:hypothetical protein
MTHRYTLAAFGFFVLLTAIFLPSHRASLDTGAKPTGAGGWTYGTARTIGQGTTVSLSDLMAREKNNPKSNAVREPVPERPAAVFSERSPNPDSPLTAAWPPTAIEKGKPFEKAAVVLPNAPQTPGLSFLGVQQTVPNGSSIPFPQGAVGPTQVVVTASTTLRSFNKTTGASDGVLDLSLSTFFSSVSGGSALSDTRVKFDPISRRWFFSNYADSSNRILFAVSNGENITAASSFTFFSFALTDGGGAELQTPTGGFCTLGIDATGVYFGLNMFAQNVNYIGSTVFVVNKANLLTATPTLTVTAFRQLNAGQLTSPGASSPFVADNPDPAAAEAYLVGTDHASFGLLVLRRITGAGTLTPAISGDFNLTVPATANGVRVPVLGRSSTLTVIDDRLFDAKIRNGSLWTVQQIGVNASGVATSPDRTASRWYEIGTLSTTPTLVQSGTLFSSATVNPDSFWVPSIGITGQGHMALAGNAAGRARFIDIVTAGRLNGDAPGTLRTPATILTAATSYTSLNSSWGLYSGLATDPNDDMTMWTFQTYAPTATTWGARAIQLRAPAPAAVTSISPTSATQGQTLDITVNGTSSGGTGFYNPPAPFPNRLAADFGPGVTVNGVTFNSPTQAVFNVTVGSGAATGTRDVTVINPDGQSATGNTLFTVNPADCGAPANINSLVSFTGGGAIAGPTCGAQGYSNDYVLNGTITNVSSQTLCSLSLQLVELAEAGGAPPAVPFRLVSADGATCTSGGLVGSVQTIGSPATLAPGQSANVTIRVAMPTLRRFRLTFNVFGGIPPSGRAFATPAAKAPTAKLFELSVEANGTARTVTGDRTRGARRG